MIIKIWNVSFITEDNLPEENSTPWEKMSFVNTNHKIKRVEVNGINVKVLIETKLGENLE